MEEGFEEGMNATLTSKQQERLSEILGNVAVAWFTTGLISQLLIPPLNLYDLSNRFLVPVCLSLFFGILSLKLAR